ncbi:hypothetical protein [Thioalkalivibrio nitratireducens]|uniref:hypothetical protein n=1 Tax=Thioalkalivibrio nitratireducens TaxID=186931 RepID=UPI001F47EBE6|nr:hypothetical protein [Thioalkalivibrio nitratireducens]
MVGLLVFKSIAPPRGAGGMQIRRITVDQFPALEIEPGQKRMRAGVHLLDRIGARKLPQCLRVQVDANIAQRRRLALHDRPTTEMGFDVGVVRRHQGNDRLAQPDRRLRTEIAAHRTPPIPVIMETTIAATRYTVKSSQLSPGGAERIPGNQP